VPELPEVETIKNELSPYVVGRSISGVTLFWEGMLRQPSPKEFYSRISRQEITGLSRRGKYLIFSLSSGDLLVIHLKMSGSLLIGKDSSEPPKYTRAIIRLDNGTRIFFSDPRKFGKIQLVKDRASVFGKLGPEPLEADFTPEVLTQRLSKRKAPIKAVLLDQSFVAGIGNMYADEALFSAGIHPLRPASSLSPDEVERLHSAIQQVLRSGIGSKGASIANYLRPDGTPGTAQFQFKVAHGRGKNCPNCGTPLKRIVVRNRGTYFCPKCQPEKA
jgi:formamidopyrimidine-DNA glycosylase